MQEKFNFFGIGYATTGNQVEPDPNMYEKVVGLAAYMKKIKQEEQDEIDKLRKGIMDLMMSDKFFDKETQDFLQNDLVRNFIREHMTLNDLNESYVHIPVDTPSFRAYKLPLFTTQVERIKLVEGPKFL